MDHQSFRYIIFAAVFTVVGALIVSFLQTNQIALLIILALVLVLHIIRSIWKNPSFYEAFSKIFIVVNTSTIGYLTESWGTSHGQWTYHHLPIDQNVPYWVPLAWSIAGEILHKLQTKVFSKNSKFHLEYLFAFSVGIIFPLLGESICIAAGVWTYAWPYKILGVPILALVLIAYTHLVFMTMHKGTQPSGL